MKSSVPVMVIRVVEKVSVFLSVVRLQDKAGEVSNRLLQAQKTRQYGIARIVQVLLRYSRIVQDSIGIVMRGQDNLVQSRIVQDQDSLGQNSNRASVGMNFVDLVWTLAFTTIVILAVVGNVMVLWVVLGRQLGKMLSNSRPTCRPNSTLSLTEQELTLCPPLTKGKEVVR